MLMYHLDKYVCDKYYRIETKEHCIYTGYMLNYNWGNIIMVSPKGIYHIPYNDVYYVIPLKKAPNEEFEAMVEAIKKGERNNESN